MADNLKLADQKALLEACRDFTDGKPWPGLFTYPSAGWDLVRMGLVTPDKKITDGGRVVLYFLGKGADPLPDTASSVTFKLDLPAPPIPVDPNATIMELKRNGVPNE